MCLRVYVEETYGCYIRCYLVCEYIYIYIYMLGVGSCQPSVSSMRTLSLPKLVLHVAVFCGLDTAHVNP